MRRRARREPTWTHRDEALLYTCHLADMMFSSAAPTEFPEVLAPFPPSDGERLWVSGSFVLSDFRALGDGSWQVSTPFAVGTGGVGLALGVGSLIGRAVVRQRAAARARADAQPRWVPMDQGTLYVSEQSFYLHTPRVLRWHWTAITGATLVAPGALHFSGNSASGPISWLLGSEWAELVFVTWALHQHPRHPQLLTGWLPPGWIEHAQACGRTVPWRLTPLHGPTHVETTDHQD